MPRSWYLNIIPVLVHTGCYNKNTADWATQTVFVSHSFRGWEVQHRGVSKFSVCCGPTSLLAVFSLCHHMAEAERKLSGVCLYVRVCVCVCVCVYDH